MTVLHANMEVLKDALGASPDDDVAKLLASTSANLDRLGALIKDLQETARIESGELKLTVGPLDHAVMVREVAESHRALLDTAGLTLVVDAPASLPMHADGGRLSQVLSNLITNASKFTPPGGNVTIRCEETTDAVTTRVIDTGIGLSTEQLPKLFAPFSQAHQESRAKGTGLGLYISKGIVAAHGGTIECTSPGVGQGTTFTVRLPRKVPVVSRDP